MNWLTDNRAVGLVLVLASLGADVVLTLKGLTIPATVASVLTAGLGLVTASVFASKENKK